MDGIVSEQLAYRDVGVSGDIRHGDTSSERMQAPLISNTDEADLRMNMSVKQPTTWDDVAKLSKAGMIKCAGTPDSTQYIES